MIDEPLPLTEFHAPELSPDERRSLTDLLQSPGWDVLVNKVWAWHRKAAIFELVRDINPRSAGFYDGLKTAENLALEYAKPKLNLHLPGGPTEAALGARGRSTKGTI